MKTAKRAHSNSPKIILIAVLIAVVAVIVIIMSAISGIGGKQNIEASKDLTLRAEPDLSSSVIAVIPKGSSVSLDLGYKSTDALWNKITTPDGTVGYMMKESVDSSTVLSSGTASSSATESSSSSSAPTDAPKPESSSAEVFAARESSSSAPASAATRAKTPETIFDSKYCNLTIAQKLDVLKKYFPNGKYWNHIGIDVSGLTQDYSCMTVTDSPCDHTWNGYEYCNEYDGNTLNEYSYDYNIQCLGFASMVSDFLFGKDAGIETFYDFDQLAVGDHIRFLSYEHSMIVIEKGDGYVKLLECNRDYENCEIEWGRTLTLDDIYQNGYDVEYLRRVN